MSREFELTPDISHLSFQRESSGFTFPPCPSRRPIIQFQSNLPSFSLSSLEISIFSVRGCCTTRPVTSLLAGNLSSRLSHISHGESSRVETRRPFHLVSVFWKEGVVDDVARVIFECHRPSCLTSYQSSTLWVRPSLIREGNCFSLA